MIRPWRFLGFSFGAITVVSWIVLLAQEHYLYAFLSYFAGAGLVLLAVELEMRRLSRQKREALVYHLF